jgi:hypothetical protein
VLFASFVVKIFISTLVAALPRQDLRGESSEKIHRSLRNFDYCSAAFRPRGIKSAEKRLTTLPVSLVNSWKSRRPFFNGRDTRRLSRKFIGAVGTCVRHSRAGGNPGFSLCFPGFRVALAIASLPGMTSELCQRTYGT